jgi:hypothetical protein
MWLTAKRKKKKLKENDSNLSYWIDICGIYNDKYLIVKGWALSKDDNENLSVYVKNSDGTHAHLLKEIRENRADVLEHLNINLDDKKPGFYQQYDISLYKNREFSLFIESNNLFQEVSLVDKYASDEQIKIICNNFFEYNEIDNKLILESADGLNISDDVKNKNENIETQEVISEVSCDNLHLVNVSDSSTQSIIENSSEKFIYSIDKAGLYKNKVVLVRGWATHTLKLERINIVIKNDNIELRVLEFFRVDRQDVAVSLGLNRREKIKFGFVILCELDKPLFNGLSIGFTYEDKFEDVKLQHTELVRQDLEYSLTDSKDLGIAQAKLRLLQYIGDLYFNDLRQSFFYQWMD